MSGFDDTLRRVIAEQHDEIAALRRENTKLREQRAWLLDKTPELVIENAKLRELVRDWRELAVGGADSLSDWNMQQADLEARMRELVVEL